MIDMPPLHPHNAIFPMMSNRELECLTESIAAIGLIEPILLDRNGALLDGKCRFKACEIARVMPRFETFDGDDEACKRLIGSRNLLRRRCSPSQNAMLEAVVVIPGWSFGYRVLPDVRAIAEYPDLVRTVIRGERSLSEAHEVVLEDHRKAERDETIRQRLEHFRKERPLLAMEVDEGTLTLDQAIAVAVPALAEHADTIRRLDERIVGGAIEIGRLLSECKSLAGYVNWLTWISHEFQWSERTAQNFVFLYEMSLRVPNVADLGLPLGSLYLLAEPSTTEGVRSYVLTSAENGDIFTVDRVEGVIDEVSRDYC